ncbi:hypothetical protein [Halomonas alkaliantarctica]|uniref:hypothetical protein n=1 Tax=Halomonas alkaliantarctica TaxID=232346 RepID=UPI0004AB120C|nr:hypothetical protein [Halomonas alkaliantarctica]
MLWPCAAIGVPVKGRWLAELSGTRCGGERVLPLLVFLDAAMLNQLDAGEPLTAVAVGWVELYANHGAREGS